MAHAQINYPNVPLGTGECGLSIKDAGCKETTWADLETWSGHPVDPPGINAELRDSGIFQNGCLLPFDGLQRLHPDRWRVESYTEFPGAADLSLLDTNTPDVYVELRINWPNGQPGDNTHFLPVFDYTAGQDESAIQVCDSYDGQVKPLSGIYGSRDAATIVSAVTRWRYLGNAQPAPQPQPSAPPAAPTAPPDEPVLQPVAPADPVVPPPTPTKEPAVQNPPVPHDVPEPGPVAEAGVSTSEWKLIVRFLYQAAAVGTTTAITYLATKFGLHVTIPDPVMSLIIDLEVAGAIAAAGYAVSRGIRKHGTNA